ncbi:hypothetical protein [Bradyrhizobium sp. Gha]|uniref:PDC sensor domain-containing protein n=1 Tax=Bradyrhizobium sp. Gha TaxID=1855318 RepID=UPI0011607436|nr:hypothetical protein [Bradyrhizobium sp. Gha]
MGALFVLSVASLEHYRFVSTSANERISRSLDIAVEHTNKVFEEIEILFASVEGITRKQSSESLKADQEHLHEALEEMIGKAPDLRAIWLFDRSGRPLVTSSVFPAPDLNNSDRDYFIAQQGR